MSVDASEAPADSDLAVVGAGVAGLCAAQRLCASGRRVVLFEAGEDIGGAARTGWLTSAGDRAWLRFLEAAGIVDDAVRPIRAFHLRSDGRLQPGLREGALPPRPRPHALRRARFTRTFAPMRSTLDLAHPERAARYDDRSLGDFAALYLGRLGAPRWLEPWLATRAPVRSETTSRVSAMLAWTQRRDRAATTLRATPSRRDPRWVGAAQLCCGTRVERVERAAEERGGVLLRTSAGPHRARALVLALPIAEARRVAAPLWSAPQDRALAALETARNALWRASLVAAPPALDLRHPALLRLHRSQSPALAMLQIDPVAGTAFARLRDDAANPEPRALAARAERLLPGLRFEPDTAVVEHAIQPNFDVGRYRAIARARERLAAATGIFACGEAWCEATLEGAAQSGWRAAGEALAYLESVSPLRRTSVAPSPPASGVAASKDST